MDSTPAKSATNRNPVDRSFRSFSRSATPFLACATLTWPLCTTMMASCSRSYRTSIILASLSSRCGNRFGEEPRPFLRLVDPYRDQAGGRDVTELVAKRVRGSQPAGQPPIIFAELAQHILRAD